MNILKYDVVNCGSLEGLTEIVNEYLVKGWIPHGGVHYSKTVWNHPVQEEDIEVINHENVFLQAMILPGPRSWKKDLSDTELN